ncbi:hypothetical protein ACE1TF_07445 [Geomicrobium sp. JSM 1781026]|uniref:hypothetical protein n=1 Tax=Geomicrobium sp. JSM 1781026 TaxID=3344580 RepID=UPI0035C211E0
MDTTTFTRILIEQLKRDEHKEYNDFINELNLAAKKCEAMVDLQSAVKSFQKYMAPLDEKLSMTNDYEDYMNMKATLLDMFVNDLNYDSVFLLVESLKMETEYEHIQTFIEPIEYWVTVIKSKEKFALA